MSSVKSIVSADTALEAPTGWLFSRLPEVCWINPPKAPADALEPGEPVTFVPMPAVDAEKGAITAAQERAFSEVRSGFTSFQDGDVIMAKITPCMENGKAAVAQQLTNGLGFGSTEFHVFRSNGAVLPEFIYHFIRRESFRRAAESEMTGSVGQKRVPLSFLQRVELPLPPLAEQRRIVERIEELLASANTARARLGRVPAILRRFRQAVLATACSGRLTIDWRATHPNTEPAQCLLNRIAEFRSNTTAVSRKGKESKHLVPETTAKEGIPEAWVSCCIGSIGFVCNGSTPSRKHDDFWNGDIPWVASGEVRNNIISKTREQITKEGYEHCSVRLLPRGSVLIAMIGEGKTRGQTAILDIEATINQNVAAVTLEHGLVDPKYLWLWFQFQYDETREQGGGTGPQALNCQRVRELPFLLPPLEEQHEIVRRVESLFNLADTIEQRVTAATERVEKLTQAILAKAFRGELVPTEAELARREGRSYESAAELLARIEAAKREATPTPHPRTRNSQTRHRRSVRRQEA